MCETATGILSKFVHLWVDTVELAQAVCPYCNAAVPVCDGPTHEYIVTSSGCWKIFGDVLAREYNDRDFWKVHRFTVDTYAAQHASGDDPRQLQSVTVHLVSLYLLIERELSEDQVRKVMEVVIQKMKGKFRKLAMPSFSRALKVSDVLKATNATEHQALVKKWSIDVWNAWKDEHEYIRQIASP